MFRLRSVGGVDVPGFQTKALVVTSISGVILDLSHPIISLVRHVCSDKAEFPFLQKLKVKFRNKRVGK